MLRKILLVFFIISTLHSLASIGLNKKYTLISQEKFENKINDGANIAIKKYIVVPQFNKNYNEILIVKEPNTIFGMFCFMLKKNMQQNMYNYKQKCDNSLNINNLIFGLYYFGLERYKEALDYFEFYKGIEYNFLKHLLIADCNFELSNYDENINNILKSYQKALDVTTNEQEKLIVNNRIKNIKYR
jgi:hypothetical protein